MGLPASTRRCRGNNGLWHTTHPPLNAIHLLPPRFKDIVPQCSRLPPLPITNPSPSLSTIPLFSLPTHSAFSNTIDQRSDVSILSPVDVPFSTNLIADHPNSMHNPMQISRKPGSRKAIDSLFRVNHEESHPFDDSRKVNYVQQMLRTITSMVTFPRISKSSCNLTISVKASVA